MKRPERVFFVKSPGDSAGDAHQDEQEREPAIKPDIEKGQEGSPAVFVLQNQGGADEQEKERKAGGPGHRQSCEKNRRRKEQIYLTNIEKLFNSVINANHSPLSVKLRNICNCINKYRI